MGWMQFFLDFFLHLDQHLAEFIQNYGGWTYGILFSIIFLETGVVFAPFLPGDSLLFAAGALAARPVDGGLNVWALFGLLTIAAILGDTLNYWIGKTFGHWMIHRPRPWIRKEHLDKTHAFFERYGGKTIVIARFVPIVRTVAPFVAGIGAMTYSKFVFYNIFGGVLWVAVCLGAGYAFGNLPWVKENFSLVILGIIFVSILPGVIEFLRARAQARRDAAPRGFPVQSAAPPEKADG